MTAPAPHAEYERALAAFVVAMRGEWSVTRTPVRSWAWVSFGRPGAPPPTQGWKLHVSASSHEAVELVERVLPELTRFAVAFKLPSSLSGVLELNSGKAGRTQVGKIITVYPGSDAVLRDVVGRLERVWRPAAAPAVPSDRCVGPGLWVRYGAFGRKPEVVDALGRLHCGVRSPDGALHPDSRTGEPYWAPGPPVPVREPELVPSADAVITVGGHGYYPLRRLTTRVDGSVVLAVRLHDLHLAVVRRAVPGVRCDEYGNDAVARLRNEHRALRELTGSPGCPTVIGFDEAAHTLVTGDVGGRSLEALPVEDGLPALVAAARTVADLHAAGFVHRDVKPPHIMFDGDRAHLVDFEFAARAGDAAPLPGGTPGYHPPDAGARVADPAHDVHALGGCLTYVMLRTCPGRLPRSGGVGRQIGLLRLLGFRTATRLLTTLTDPDAARRPSADRAGRLLDEAVPALLSEARAAAARPPRGDGRWSRTAAVAAGRASRSFRAPTRNGHHWRNAHLYAGFATQGVNIGAAGTVIGLTSIDEALGLSCFADDVLGAANWLVDQPSYAHAHGLFTGNAGVAVALALVGRRHGRDRLITAARRRLVAAAAHVAPDFDLFSGAAGVVWAGTLLAGILDDTWPLDVVEGQVGRINRSSTAVRGAPVWPSSPEFDASGAPYFGAAHGAAGIALALAAWGSATASPGSTALAAEVLTGVHDVALTPDRDNILPADHLGAFPPQAWCHGLAGFVWCLEQAFGGSDALAGVRAWAADAILRAAPVVHDPTLCHGAAGSLEVYRMLGADPRVGPAAAVRARQAVAILRVLQQRVPAGTVWGSEEPTVVSPDLWVGFLGPAAAVALHAGDVGSPLVSRHWLRRCARNPSAEGRTAPAFRPREPSSSR